MKKIVDRTFFKGIEGARRRSIYHACGYSTHDLNRPHIGIVNAFNEAAPGHTHLRSLAEAVPLLSLTQFLPVVPFVLGRDIYATN
jgi:dihydroxyacid dehydratase/phosphogluconate dehydratase